MYKSNVRSRIVVKVYDIASPGTNVEESHRKLSMYSLDVYSSIRVNNDKRMYQVNVRHVLSRVGVGEGEQLSGAILKDAVFRGLVLC